MELNITRPTQANLKKADKNAVPMTFDVSKVKSTVTNPSQIFKGISVEDEQKISKIVNEKLPNGSAFEKQQALQGLYNAALNAQKQKDIDAGRQQVKLALINKANNANGGKEKNTYMSQVKKADLADLIKDQFVKQGYKASDFMNFTDDGIIAGFLDTNPEYKDAFNKYFYNNDDAVQLGKDLGWIEKTTWDKVGDKIEGITEGVVGWTPKRGEGVKDFLDKSLAGTDYNRTSQQNLDTVAFGNFVQEKYGTYPGALTDRDLAQAKKDFEANKEANQKQYTPTYGSAFTKMAEGLTDIAFTAGGLKGTNLLKNNLFKLGFSTLANDDYMSRAPELLGDGLSFVGENINKLPGFSDIRDSLQTEQDKADWDAFVAGNVLALVRGGKRKINQIKGADMQGLKDSFDKVKKGDVQGGMETLKENAMENRQTKLEKEKMNAAQKVTQGEIETSKTASKGLDLLNKEGKLNTKNSFIKRVLGSKERPVKLDELQKNVDEVVNRLKEEQTTKAQGEKKLFGHNDLGVTEKTDILDNNGKKTQIDVAVYPLDKLLDRIVEHYKDIDEAKATEYSSYKTALKNGKLPAETILEIRREGNSLNQKVYNNKTNQYKDTDKAQQWAKNMEKVNKVIDGLDIGEDIRKRDAQLSSLYTIQEGLKNIKKAEANFNKKAIKESGLASGVGKTISRILGKLSFGTTNFMSKALVSMLQESLGSTGFMKTSYNAAEIASKIPEFVKDYQNLVKKIEGEPMSKNKLEKIVSGFIDEWNLEAQQNDTESD